jgi:hypothetical protein
MKMLVTATIIILALSAIIMGAIIPAWYMLSDKLYERGVMDGE